jgi:uroporphyrinogen decarboxylase
MNSIVNDQFLRACLRMPTAYTPVWLMRQAGRYLPEYRATRAKAGSFMALATNPDLATEVTLQPLERYDLDAAILFSDILTVPDAMGLGLSFAQGEGPRFAKPLRHESDITALTIPDMDRLNYVFDAVKCIRKALTMADGRSKIPLIGFSGSPWTLACYMVEGAGSDDYRQIKTLMYARPDLMHHILRVNAQSVAAYLNEQIKAGAQAVMLFDSWGGVLADGLFQEFSLAYSKQVLGSLIREWEGQKIPSILFTKGGGQWLDVISQVGSDVVGLDWTTSLSKARKLVNDQVALQGNIDPMALMAGEQAIRQEVQRTLLDFGRPQRQDGNWGGHIFNLGHGIHLNTPMDAVAILIDEVKTYSQRIRLGR